MIKDPVLADEARHDRGDAPETDADRLDNEIDTIWNEVLDGQHDREIFESSYIDTELMGRIARIAACGYKTNYPAPIPATDLNDLKLQIADYVKDAAELRLAR